MERTSKTGREIADELAALHDAGGIAATVEHYWPTIKAALLAYDKIVSE